MTDAGVYHGRFAPSPTGPLHFGSLVAALGSFLQARAQEGTWRVRMEDIDPPREVAGAADSILRTLEAFGLTWDGEVLYQSRRGEAYRAALADLERDGMLYACRCSRRELAPYGGRYPGFCRGRRPSSRGRQAWRVLTDAEPIRFTDAVQGPFTQSLAEAGDFILLRRDGYFAYQLAVVIDDAHQGITEVVRGSDLLDSTARQIHLQRLLGFATPGYVHLPVAVNAAGDKLSKQTRARALDPARPLPDLLAALAFLGQRPAAELADGTPGEVVDWAVRHWRLDRVPRRLTLPAAAANRSRTTTPWQS